MTEKSQAVKVVEAALSLGFSLPEAVSKALGRSLQSWAYEHGHRPNEVSMCLNAYPQRPYTKIRDDLAASLGVEREWLDRVIESQAGEREGAEVT